MPTKLMVIGGSNPDPQTFGRLPWLGPKVGIINGTGKRYPGNTSLPGGGYYNAGPQRDEFWAEHSTSIYKIAGSSVFHTTGMGLEYAYTSTSNSWSSVFVGHDPVNINFGRDPMCQMISGAGITGITFDWERYQGGPVDEHRFRLQKVGIMQRTGNSSYRFHDMSFMASACPNKPTGDIELFSFKNPAHSKNQYGTIHCEVFDRGDNTWFVNNGINYVCGLGFQFQKESGSHLEKHTNAKILIKNFRFHTYQNKQVILPRKKVYPFYGEMPDNKYEFYTYEA